MDLTPDLLLEAKFAPARRGYDMNEVDDFLERCAEGLDVLLARLRAEFDRAESAEAALVELRATGAAPSGDATTADIPPASAPTISLPDPKAVVPSPSPSAEPEPERERVQEPMRILIAAERTAEAAVADARAEAERIRAEAESVASTTRSEAETLLARSRAEAEAEARRAGDEARRTIESEVLALRQDRDLLSQDVHSLRTWLDDQRSRLRTAAQDLQRIVDDPDSLGELPVPEVHEDSGTAVEPEAELDEPDDARPAVDVEGDFDGGLDVGEPTQAVPVVDGQAGGGGGIFDDEQAPNSSSLFGTDAIR